jgi:ABC-type multidrug transport system fused ATPase/permease subunit
VENLIALQLFRVLLDVGKFAGGAVVVFVLNWRLSLIAAAFVPFLVLNAAFFRRPVRNAANELMEATGRFFKALQEVLAGIGLVKAVGRNREERDRLMEKVRAIFPPERRSALWSAASTTVTGFVTSAGMAAVLGYGAYEVIQGRTTLGVVVSFMGYLGYLYGPSMSLTNFPVQVQPAFVALRRTLALLRIAPEPSGGIEPRTLSGDFRFEGVTFGYGDGGPVIREASFAVRAGEKVGVAGPTGAGKSTLLKLMMGFYEPREGRVTLDGIPVGDYAPRAYRKVVGYIPQGAFFFSDTVAGNLLWASPRATPEAIGSALEKAQAKDFVAGLPQGLETPIGEGGKRLSGGEKQRLAAARTLLLGPRVLLMDEGTSDLDEATELRLLEDLLETFKGSTVVLVSHRATALEKMDRVITVEAGEVREEEVKK